MEPTRKQNRTNVVELLIRRDKIAAVTRKKTQITESGWAFYRKLCIILIIAAIFALVSALVMMSLYFSDPPAPIDSWVI